VHGSDPVLVKMSGTTVVPAAPSGSPSSTDELSVVQLCGSGGGVSVWVGVGVGVAEDSVGVGVGPGAGASRKNSSHTMMPMSTRKSAIARPITTLRVVLLFGGSEACR
jgi:hypothetical protein